MVELIQKSAIEVYRELGPGHSEAVYESAMLVELSLYREMTHPILRQIPCPIKYKGFTVGIGYIDIIVDDIVLELKAVTKLTIKEEWQVRKYLSGTGLETGILINFGPEQLEMMQIDKESNGETDRESGDIERPLLPALHNETVDPRSDHGSEVSTEGRPGKLEGQAGGYLST